MFDKFVWFLSGILVASMFFITISLPSEKERFLKETSRKHKKETMIVIGYGDIINIWQTSLHEGEDIMTVSFKDEKEYLKFKDRIFELVENR